MKANSKVVKKQTDMAKESDKENKDTTLKRDITPMFDYYKAWDKFADVSALPLFNSSYRQLRRKTPREKRRLEISFRPTIPNQRRKMCPRLKLR